jgi:DNA-binding NtrC family response regulator
MRSCEGIVVLIVDDDASFRNGVAANLTDDGHIVHEYADPSHVTTAHLAAANVVVTDFDMPSTDGLTFAEGVHRARPDLAVVLATAYWTVEVEASAATRPYVHLCRKPLDYEQLHVRIHELSVVTRPGIP